ncbi:MAG: putative lipid II flippase FtsW [Acidiferrobacteraceae bacterium]|nr:putative lipid II flippase FtsW [Acidiferrobacteraceae bacterium]
MIATTFQARRQARAAAGYQGPDRWLVGSLAMLVLIGLVMGYSASISLQTNGMGGGILVRQLIHILLAILVAYAVWKTPLKFWEVSGKYLLTIGILLLVAVLVVGIEVNGSQRWISFGLFTVQPSELAKLFMVIYLSCYLTRKHETLGEFKTGILIVGMVLAVYAVLLLMEPDFGSLVVIALTAGLMLFLAGIRFHYFLGSILAGGVTFAALIWFSPYRMERLLSFWEPFDDPYGKGFQLVQALIAHGRGGWTGAGLGESVQKLEYLPMANSDFLFSVIGEEMGFVGIALILSLFTLFYWRVFIIARRAEQTGQLFAARLAQGISLLVVLQAMIHAAVNLGALPTKGLTLPFMSFGGSSLVANLMAASLLLVVDRDSRVKPGRRR